VVVDVNPSMHADLPVISAAVTELFHKKARSGASAQRRTAVVFGFARSSPAERCCPRACRRGSCCSPARTRRWLRCSCPAPLVRARGCCLPVARTLNDRAADASPAAWDAARPVTDNDANRKCEDEGNPDLYTHQQARLLACARFRAFTCCVLSSQQGRVRVCVRDRTQVLLPLHGLTSDEVKYANLLPQYKGAHASDCARPSCLPAVCKRVRVCAAASKSVRLTHRSLTRAWSVMDALFVAKELLLAGSQGIGAKCVRRSEERVPPQCKRTLTRRAFAAPRAARRAQCGHAHHLHLRPAQRRL
jgi:hypothetical protein